MFIHTCLKTGSFPKFWNGRKKWKKRSFCNEICSAIWENNSLSLGWKRVAPPPEILQELGGLTPAAAAVAAALPESRQYSLRGSLHFLSLIQIHLPLSTLHAAKSQITPAIFRQDLVISFIIIIKNKTKKVE